MEWTIDCKSQSILCTNSGVLQQFMLLNLSLDLREEGGHEKSQYRVQHMQREKEVALNNMGDVLFPV